MARISVAATCLAGPLALDVAAARNRRHSRLGCGRNDEGRVSLRRRGDHGRRTSLAVSQNWLLPIEAPLLRAAHARLPVGSVFRHELDQAKEIGVELIEVLGWYPMLQDRVSADLGSRGDQAVQPDAATRASSSGPVGRQSVMVGSPLTAASCTRQSLGRRPPMWSWHHRARFAA